MDTKKLYMENPFLKSGSFTVDRIILSEEDCPNYNLRFVPGTALIVLQETIFYPGGGGQPCDTGMLGGLAVTEVFEEKSENAVVFHRVKLPEDGCPPPYFVKGAVLDADINWDRRFLHMQMHLAEHILSGLFYSMYGGINRGFHMGTDYFTIDMDFPGKTKVQEISEGDIKAVEKAANRVVQKDMSVRTKCFSKREETESLPLRKKSAVDEDISIVFVGNSESPIDCVACCGTHPDTTGKIGLISIMRSENYKGMLRLTAKAGSAAVEDAIEKKNIINELCSMYSAEQKNLTDRISSHEEKNREMRKELSRFKKVCSKKKPGKSDACANRNRRNETDAMSVKAQTP